MPGASQSITTRGKRATFLASRGATEPQRDRGPSAHTGADEVFSARRRFVSLSGEHHDARGARDDPASFTK